MSYSNSFPSVRPTTFDFANSGKLDSRISFSRTDTPPTYSAPSAVHYWSNEKHVSSLNLLKYSTAFDSTAWNGNNIPAPTTGQTDPSGGTGGCILIADTTNGSHNKFQANAATGDLSFTVYAKPAAGTMRMMLNLYNATNDWEVFLFDLTGGTPVAASGTSSTFSNVSATQTASGNGYYKCTIKATGSITNAIVALNPNATTSGLDAYGDISFAGDGTAGITVAFASLSTVGSSDYNATTSQIHREYASTLKSVTNSGDPRLEFDPITNNAEGLLIEQQSTNLTVASQQVDTWGKDSVSVQSNVAISPDGTLGADRIVDNADGPRPHYAYKSTPLGVSVGATVYTISFFAKASGHSELQTYDNAQNTSGNLTVNLANGTITSGTGVIQACGDGWYRISYQATADASTTSVARILMKSGGSNSYTGDSYSGILLWGLQVEIGSAPTSYIKTATSATATRSADSCSVALSDAGYNGGPVTGIVEANNIGKPYPTFATLTDSTANQRVMVQGSSTASIVETFVVVGGSVVANPNSALTLSSSKVGFRCDTDNFATVVNGGTVATDTSGPQPATMTTLHIGSKQDGNFQVNGTIGRLSLYSAALSNVELQSLTSNP
ncbi:putative carbohydrate-binding protein [uncultured Mediterranean phage uvMED]|nr:putative carbohydrate-binding protein [uncultured Mediterranean phage uvMED]BAQ84428.1 putative carbohydrate-binding protein [uncultured Mediterranean phage uvMED]BAQ84439.1 putative carbohydrate-binding protein [uncultured Mediterranean phage uvMED]BAQ84510.1 putative carbohydrate-binding protein [uncultured Mediterranean phage uvMED]BAQ84522.1 putative carbohydrate-binding protein [uncultured Mediterranean phage uvMED]